MRRIIAIAALVGLAACGQPDSGQGSGETESGQPQAVSSEGGPNLEVILADKAAPNLSDYGLFKDAGARQPVASGVKYDLVNPLFSDYAGKHRVVYVPDGEAAAYEEDEVFDFPVGTVLAKTFAFAPDMRTPDVDERYLETRLLIHKADGWVAYPYVWNEDQTEAVYAPAGAWRDVSFIDPSGQSVSIEYRIPNQNQCKTCHHMGDAIAPIGPKARNLNHEGPYQTAQLTDWAGRGILTGLPDVLPSMPDAFDATAPLDERARAYLDINCAHCHRAEGSASNSGLWLGWTVDDPTKIGIGKHPTAAGRGSGDRTLVIDPGYPDQSIITFRMDSSEAGIAMPELGRALIDDDGVDLVRAWIGDMTPAP
ncbi:SO2930 family diheme c-type cytochrome [Henriciella litoralis]|uniref:SO2930 family diheme c-type cytochrome n=1 Tax=Henriciella litoralis TaxID=568102 RepID=UPI0009FF0F8D|nr:SO2930 family diheme c-type cytochrome [Henriciella litoralis]